MLKFSYCSLTLILFGKNYIQGMKFKQFIGQVHLWLGLVVGIPFFLVALSGAIYTWEPEMAHLIYRQSVEPQNQPFVSASALKATLDHEHPDLDLRTVLFRDETKAAQVLLYGRSTYFHAFLNPYTGDLIHLQDMRQGILHYLKILHRNLLLGDIGREIVHWVTLLFLIMMITGIVLWWPTRKSQRKQKLTIKWTASPKRLNYDLHNVLGFYMTWIAIFSVITGLFWGFEVVQDTLKVVTQENKSVYDTLQSDTLYVGESGVKWTLIDSLATVFQHQYPAKFVRVSNPHQKAEPIRVVLIESDRLVYNTNHYYFDRYTGEQLRGNFEYGLYSEASTFRTLNGLVYDAHFGTIWGLPGRLLVFFSSLVAASLPITGFLVWLHRRKKYEKSQST